MPVMIASANAAAAVRMVAKLQRTEKSDHSIGLFTIHITCRRAGRDGGGGVKHERARKAGTHERAVKGVARAASARQRQARTTTRQERGARRIKALVGEHVEKVRQQLACAAE